MAAFEGTHDFVLATPDGALPTLNINGFGLFFHAGSSLSSTMLKHTLQSSALCYSPQTMRDSHPNRVQRRDSELDLSRRLLGKLPVSTPLPKTVPEATSIRDQIIASFADLPTKKCYSIKELLDNHRGHVNGFSLADFAFVHMPGGHAPMVDFNDNTMMGELLNTLREVDVPISLICHAPVALTSAKYRVDAAGAITTNDNHAFKGAKIMTVPTMGEKMALMTQYPKIPGVKTRLAYYVDEALKQAGYNVELTWNPGAPNVVWDEDHGVLTGNGPQAVDEQAAALAKILRDRALTRAAKQ